MKQRSGLSLVELLVAMSVIGIAFAALISSQVFSFKVTKESQQSSIAKDIASQQMETIRGYGYAVYKNCPSRLTLSNSAAPICSKSGQTISNHSGYTLDWSVTNQPLNPGKTSDSITLSPPPLVGVTVTVKWGNESYVLTSYLSCADAGDSSSTTINCPSDSLRTGL